MARWTAALSAPGVGDDVDGVELADLAEERLGGGMSKAASVAPPGCSPCRSCDQAA